MEKIFELLKKFSAEKAVYYRLLDEPKNDSRHFDVMENRGAELLYGSLPSGEEFYAMGVIPIANIFDFISSWEISSHEGIGKHLEIRGRNEDGDQIVITVFPQGSPIGALFGGVEIPPEDFERVWEELKNTSR